MKKAFISLAILATVSSASALEFGTGYTRDITNDQNGYGIQVSENWNKWSLTAQADRFDGVQDQFSVIAGYEVAKVWRVSLDAQAGVSYIYAENTKDGLTSVVGLSATMPVIKNVSVTTDLRRQIGMDAMKQYDGTSLGVGIKYKF
jgi:hypothetical protein